MCRWTTDAEESSASQINRGKAFNNKWLKPPSYSPEFFQVICFIRDVKIM
jgi:hypothetical protein